MKKKLLHFLLLFSLFFNIAHATVLTTEADCHHESVHEYVVEQSASTACSDLCDIHHLFHFMAIIDTPLVSIETSFHKAILTHKASRYTSPFQKTSIKPPIA